METGHRDAVTPWHRTDNVQILFSPGCEQPLRDNYTEMIRWLPNMRILSHLPSIDFMNIH